MATPNDRERCGRCSFTTVVDAVEGSGEHDGDGESGGDEAHPRGDPFAGGSIEVDERELRLASTPAILAGHIKRRLDDTVHGIVYDR